jgi:hypothetical protein
MHFAHIELVELRRFLLDFLDADAAGAYGGATADRFFGNLRRPLREVGMGRALHRYAQELPR